MRLVLSFHSVYTFMIFTNNHFLFSVCFYQENDTYDWKCPPLPSRRTKCSLFQDTPFAWGDTRTVASIITSVTLCSISWPGHHDDVIKWNHFPRYWPFVRRIHRSPVNSPHKGQWRGALMFSLICAWINGWVNNRETGNLRRHRAHYDVIVMMQMKEYHGHWQQKLLVYSPVRYIKV